MSQECSDPVSMILAFQNEFGGEYEGGANWLEVTLRSLGTLPNPPTCLVVNTSPELLPASLRQSAHVQAVPLSCYETPFARRVVQSLRWRIKPQPWEEPALTRLASDYEVDLWISFAWFHGVAPHRPMLVCYPDFQFREMAEFFSPEDIRAREEQWEKIAKYARGIFAISHATANDALKLQPQIEPKLYVCGFPPVFQEADLSLNPENVRRQFFLPQRFFLVCNQFWEHKNHLLVLRALNHLQQQGITPPVVAFTGRPFDRRRPNAFSDLLRFVHEHDLHQYCRFCGVLPRNEQLALIRSAEAVIQPSRFEGRGAIAEETSLLGTQLLCSDLPVHRELDLADTIFFGVDDHERLAELLQRSYPRTKSETTQIVEQSQSRAHAYGQRLMEIVEDVLGKA